MMKLRNLLLIVGLLIIVSGLACSKPKTDESAAKDLQNDANASLDKASDSLDEASIALQKQMDDFRLEMNNNLASLDTKLDELQAKREAIADAKAKESYDARLAQIKSDRDALQLRLDQINSQKKDKTDWDEFENETKSAWHDLENGVKDVFDSLGF